MEHLEPTTHTHILATVAEANDIFLLHLFEEVHGLCGAVAQEATFPAKMFDVFTESCGSSCYMLL